MGGGAAGNGRQRPPTGTAGLGPAVLPCHGAVGYRGAGVRGGEHPQEACAEGGPRGGREGSPRPGPPLFLPPHTGAGGVVAVAALGWGGEGGCLRGGGSVSESHPIVAGGLGLSSLAQFP